jgi:hypothetical protein
MTYTDMLNKLIEAITPYVTFSKPNDAENELTVTIAFEDLPAPDAVFVSPLIISDDELDDADTNYDVCSDQSDEEVVINLERLWSR